MTGEQASTVETALAVLADRVDTMRQSVERVEKELGAQRGVFTPRTEWEQRNRFVDETFRSLGREIADLRTEVRARRVPWPSVLAAVAAAIALGLSIVDRMVA